MWSFQESVCATFGVGASSACVVDVGDQKTSICCVEDGISQKNTRLTMDFGGSDITRCFYWLLKRVGFPYKKCNLGERMDALFLQELKETYCHLDQVILMQLCLSPTSQVPNSQMYMKFKSSFVPLEIQDLCGQHALHMQLRHPEKPVVKYTMYAGDERLLAPLGAFHPEMFGLGSGNLCHKVPKYVSDPSDPLDDDYLEQTMSKHEQVLFFSFTFICSC